jgi:hypothetical protein
MKIQFRKCWVAAGNRMAAVSIFVWIEVWMSEELALVARVVFVYPVRKNM